MIEETRLRKVCVQCGSLYIKKSKKNNGMYLCTKCHALFRVPATKEYKTVAHIPSGLLKIMKEKKRETALNEYT
jgi:DNA-directed RNA polymerase subunit M/transcription elongation factor TFIIS